DGELGSRPAETCPTSGGAEPCSRAPIAVAGGLRVIAISAGTRHVCALAADSTAYCWGHNEAGQLGNGTTADTALPVVVSGGLKSKSVTSGFDHRCALTAAGGAYCWGDNANGQLGTGNTRGSDVPVLVANQP